MSMVGSSRNSAASSPSRLWPLICFALLGGLSADRWSGEVAVGLSALSSLVLGWLLMTALGWMLALFVRKMGRRGVKTAVSRGFCLLIPFTILALAAESGLGWQAAGAFAATGIMTSSTAVAAELARSGAGKLSSSLLSLLGGAAMTSGWMLALTLLQSILM